MRLMPLDFCPCTTAIRLAHLCCIIILSPGWETGPERDLPRNIGRSEDHLEERRAEGFLQRIGTGVAGLRYPLVGWGAAGWLDGRFGKSIFGIPLWHQTYADRM